MKKLILLLLFPLISFSQITLQEILAIETELDFKRTFIENGFQEETEPANAEKLVTYSKQLLVTEISASFRRSDSLSAKAVVVMFTPDASQKNDIYEGIYNKVKKDCKFYEVRNSIGMDVAFYNCPDENPDPKLVALNEKIKEIPNRPNSIEFNLTDLQIGFVKNNGLYTIQYPIYDIDVDELIELTNKMMKMMKEMDIEQSNQ
ncbi:MAG: hypothetical protein ACJ0NM_01875 [Flavobacteriaceae bacterium]